MSSECQAQFLNLTERLTNETESGVNGWPLMSDENTPLIGLGGCVTSSARIGCFGGGRPMPSMYAGSKAVRKRARDEDTASNTSASGSVCSSDSCCVSPETPTKAMPTTNSRSRRSSSLPAPTGMLAERPKRQIVPKSPENSVTGLSWREETQLKKALYASLNESKLQRSLSKEPKDSESGNVSESSQAAVDNKSATVNGTNSSKNEGKNTLKPGLDDMSKNKVRAQRKFAEGSRPNSPCVTPVKPKDPPTGSPSMMSGIPQVDIPPTKKLQKTEDFLTFLCIRKNPFLPPQFEVFKQPTVIEQMPPYRTSSSRLSVFNRGSNKKDDLGVRPLVKKAAAKPTRVHVSNLRKSWPCCFKPESKWWLHRDTKRGYWPKNAVSFDDIFFPSDHVTVKVEDNIETSSNSTTEFTDVELVTDSVHVSMEPEPVALEATVTRIKSEQDSICGDVVSNPMLNENWDIDIEKYTIEHDKDKIDAELLGPDKDSFSPLLLPCTPQKRLLGASVNEFNSLADHNYSHDDLLDRVTAIINRNTHLSDNEDCGDSDAENKPVSVEKSPEIANDSEEQVVAQTRSPSLNDVVNESDVHACDATNNIGSLPKANESAGMHPLTRLFGSDDQCIRLSIIHAPWDVIHTMKGTLETTSQAITPDFTPKATEESLAKTKFQEKSDDVDETSEVNVNATKEEMTATENVSKNRDKSSYLPYQKAVSEERNLMKIKDNRISKFGSIEDAAVDSVTTRSKRRLEGFRNVSLEVADDNNNSMNEFHFPNKDRCDQKSTLNRSADESDQKTSSVRWADDIIQPTSLGTSHFQNRDQWYDDEKPMKPCDSSNMLLWPLPSPISTPAVWKCARPRKESQKRKKTSSNSKLLAEIPIKRPRGRPLGSKTVPKVQTGVVAATKLAKAARQTMMRKSRAKAASTPRKTDHKNAKKSVKISQRQLQMRKRLRQRLVRKLRPRRSRVPIEALMMSDQDDEDYFEDYDLVDVLPPSAALKIERDDEADVSSGEDLDVDDDEDGESSEPRSLRSTTVAVRNSFSNVRSSVSSSPRKSKDGNKSRNHSRHSSRTSYRDTDSESIHSISDSVTSSNRSTRSACVPGTSPSPLKATSFYCGKRKLSPVVPLKLNIAAAAAKSSRSTRTSNGSASTSRDSTPVSRNIQTQRKRAFDEVDCLPGVISNLDQILSEVPKCVKNNHPIKRPRGRPSKSDIDESTRSPLKKKIKRSRSVKDGEQSYSGVGSMPGGSNSHILHCPVYKPTEQEFKDPISYITSIREEACQYGMCRIIPPESWKPDCKVHDEMRFISQLQYIHMLREKWGPSLQKLECIKKHLHTQDVDLETLPMIGGVELDLPRLSSVIHGLGGLRNVPDKKRWGKVADLLGISKLALDRMNKLYDAYCRYLLSYDTLSDADKQLLEDSVLEDWNSGELPTPDNIVRGRSYSLSGFYRAARNTFNMWFKDVDATTDQIENEYWNIIDERQHHVAVQYGHVDTKTSGSGFPSKKENPYCKHPWNLNVLAMNNGSLLRSLGAVSGVTIPTLHIGMLFSTKCWSRDSHMLPYINYLHTGANVIWYSIVKGQVGKFKQLMAELNDQPITSKNSSVMVSPEVLIEGGVNVCRTVQSQREFVIIFPETYCASVCCGYNISESVHYATTDYLPLGTCAAKVKGSVELADASEVEKFSMDKLLFVLAKSEKTNVEVLQSVLPHLESAIDTELSLRQQLQDAGLKNADQMVMLDENVYAYAKKRKNLEFMEEEDNICKVSRKICYFSMVVNVAEDKVYSLPHALQHIQKKKNLRACKLMYRHSEEELTNLVASVKDRLKLPAKKKPSKKTSSTSR